MLMLSGLCLLTHVGCAGVPAGGGDTSGNDNVSNDNAGDDGGSQVGWQEVARLDAFDPQGDDLYGDAVGTSGDIVAVGTQHKETLAGVVDVYLRFGGEWRYSQRLPRGAARFPEQGFGCAVAVSNQFVFVGALKHSIEGSFGIQNGAVYVFRNLGPSWEQAQLLTVVDSDDFEYFGNSLAFEPDQGRLVVGGVGRGNSQGAAYVFVTNGSIFTQEARLTASDGINFEDFGDAVATQGQTIVVGASNQNFGTGAVYVFEREADWVEHQKILAPDADQSDKFGAAVALDGNTLVIAAPSKKRPGDELLQAGVVYVYERFNGAWEVSQIIVPNDRDAGIFGDSVALRDGVLVIAVPSKSEAVILEKQDGQWVEVDRVSSGNEVFVLDSFGNAMALQDGTLVIGARSADVGGQRAAGSAYVFEVADGDGVLIDDGVRAKSAGR